MNSFFSFVISSFTDMDITQVSIFIDQIQRGPVTIFIGLPCCAVVILCNCVLDSIFCNGGLQVGYIFLKGKFGIMVADDDKSLIAVFFV